MVVGITLFGVLTSVIALCVALWTDPRAVRREAEYARREVVRHTLEDIIRDNLFCANCNGRVTVSNCTGWDQDGNVWDDCNGNTPLIYDCSYKTEKPNG